MTNSWNWKLILEATVYAKGSRSGMYSLFGDALERAKELPPEIISFSWVSSFSSVRLLLSHPLSLGVSQRQKGIPFCFLQYCYCSDTFARARLFSGGVLCDYCTAWSADCASVCGEKIGYILRDFATLPPTTSIFSTEMPLCRLSLRKPHRGRGGYGSSRGRPVRCRRSRSRLCCAAWFRTRSRVAMVPAWRALTTHWSPQAMPR